MGSDGGKGRTGMKGRGGIAGWQGSRAIGRLLKAERKGVGMVVMAGAVKVTRRSEAVRWGGGATRGWGGGGGGLAKAGCSRSRHSGAAG